MYSLLARRGVPGEITTPAADEATPPLAAQPPI
jgi:hypothetical protein